MKLRQTALDRYHVRCGDLTSPDCRLEEQAAAMMLESVIDTGAAKDAKTKDKAKKGKRDSKKLSKSSPHASTIAV